MILSHSHSHLGRVLEVLARQDLLHVFGPIFLGKEVDPNEVIDPEFVVQVSWSFGGNTDGGFRNGSTPSSLVGLFHGKSH